MPCSGRRILSWIPGEVWRHRWTRCVHTGFVACTLVLACDTPQATRAEPAQKAEYILTFEATWSAQTHPTSFPPNPHFSGLVGSTHDGGVSFWGVGQSASPGIESMAEIGSKSPLLAEIADAIAAGAADSLLSGGGISASPGSVSLSFEIDADFPLVTLVSMIAPSPDWFVGVSGLSLLQDGDWVDEMIVELLPYDAGTDSGPTYVSPNQDTNPQEPIFRITEQPIGNGVALGTFRFTRDIITTTEPGAPTTTLPARTALLCNVPNPFNPTTWIRFDLARDDHVTVRVYDVTGRVVRTLVDRQLPRARHEFVWDGSDDGGSQLPSGAYYRLRTPQVSQTRKIIVAKQEQSRRPSGERFSAEHDLDSRLQHLAVPERAQGRGARARELSRQ